MKLAYTILCLLIISAGTNSSATAFQNVQKNDTVVINLGNSSKLLILVDDPREINRISELDVNEMLKDLSNSIDSMGGNEQYIKIEDRTGEKYRQRQDVETEGTSVTDIDELRIRIKEEIKDEIRSEFNSKGEEKEKHKSRNRNRTNSYFNMELGMNNYLQDGGFPDETNELYSVKPWGSWYLGFNFNNRTKIAGPLFFDWGAGISWNNFKHQNAQTRLVKGDDAIIYFEELDVNNPLKSKLSLTHLNVTLLPMLNFGRSGEKNGLFHWDYYGSSFRMGLGGYAGYRIDSWAKYVWEEDGNRKKDRDKSNYYLNNLRYGAKFIVGYKSMDLFINYDLSELYTEGNGPKLNAFSFGIIL